MKKFIYYILGMIILALGLCLNTKTNLGVSALMAIPYSISEMFNLNLGNVTFIYYIVFILIEIMIHLKINKKAIITDLLQIIVSILFTRVLNIFNNIIPMFTKENVGIILSNLPVRIILVLISITLVGIGAYLTIICNLVPNPSDGIVKAISDYTNKKLGTIKNIVDISFVIITCALSFIIKGKIIGVGLGTIMAMLLVGRVIAFCNNKYPKLK